MPEKGVAVFEWYKKIFYQDGRRRLSNNTFHNF